MVSLCNMKVPQAGAAEMSLFGACRVKGPRGQECFARLAFAIRCVVTRLAVAMLPDRSNGVDLGCVTD